ncbi:hypothetical protein MCUN1_003424 [Malassezia cuniculi]|uniref:ML-like domain-containing protein n=1 Tax=Malassezia cuniculi TaxID=948313 RepID=A0AAF0JD46_9BASI|nr:hypothetical protein MCUN1_003424 [Malassezia cuniculi]
MRLCWLTGVLATLCTFLLPVHALDFSTQRIVTDTVAYCGQPHAILVNGLNIGFYRHNNSVVFSFDATTIPNNLSSTVNVHLYAFGLDVVELSLDLCSIAGSALCPLPTYALGGGGEYTLPQETMDMIPSIVYTVLDIEAVAILHVIDQSSGNIAECFQVTLSNGRTTNIPAVRWSVVIATGVMALVAVVHSVWPTGMGAIQWRIVDLVGTLQHIVYVSFTSIMMPKVFYQFAYLFLWSTGIIFIEPVQRAILNLRLHTRAYDYNIMYDPQLKAQVIRDTNLYATHMLGEEAQKLKQNITHIISGITSDEQKLFGRSLPQIPFSNYSTPQMLAASAGSVIEKFAPNTGPGGEMTPGAQSSSVVSVSTTPDFTQLGIKFMSERAGVSPYGLFLTVLISWLFFLCMVVAALMFMYVVHAILYAKPGTVPRIERAALRHTPVPQLRLFYRQAMRPVLVRVLQMATQPLFIFTMYQWAHSRSWASHLIAAGAFVIVVVAWIMVIFPVFRVVRRTRDPSVLYFNEMQSPYDLRSQATKVGSLAQPWAPRCYWFGAVQPLFYFVRACFIAFPQNGLIGLRQCVGLLAVELIYLGLLLFFRPGRDRTSDWFNAIMCLTRIAAWAVTVSLSPEAAVYGIPRAVLGYVILVVTGVPYIIVFFVMVWDAISPLFFRRQRWFQSVVERKDVEDSHKGNVFSSSRWEPLIRQRSARDNNSDDVDVSYASQVHELNTANVGYAAHEPEASGSGNQVHEPATLDNENQAHQLNTSGNAGQVHEPDATNVDYSSNAHELGTTNVDYVSHENDNSHAHAQAHAADGTLAHEVHEHVGQSDNSGAAAPLNWLGNQPAKIV